MNNTLKLRLAAIALPAFAFFATQAAAQAPGGGPDSRTIAPAVVDITTVDKGQDVHTAGFLIYQDSSQAVVACPATHLTSSGREKPPTIRLASGETYHSTGRGTSGSMAALSFRGESSSPLPKLPVLPTADFASLKVGDPVFALIDPHARFNTGFIRGTLTALPWRQPGMLDTLVSSDLAKAVDCPAFTADGKFLGFIETGKEGELQLVTYRSIWFLFSHDENATVPDYPGRPARSNNTAAAPQAPAPALPAVPIVPNAPGNQSPPGGPQSQPGPDISLLTNSAVQINTKDGAFTGYLIAQRPTEAVIVAAIPATVKPGSSTASSTSIRLATGQTYPSVGGMDTITGNIATFIIRGDNPPLPKLAVLPLADIARLNTGDPVLAAPAAGNGTFKPLAAGTVLSVPDPRVERYGTTLTNSLQPAAGNPAFTPDGRFLGIITVEKDRTVSLCTTDKIWLLFPHIDGESSTLGAPGTVPRDTGGNNPVAATGTAPATGESTPAPAPENIKPPAVTVTAVPANITVTGGDITNPGMQPDLAGKIQFDQAPAAGWLVEAFFVIAAPNNNGHYILAAANIPGLTAATCNFKFTCDTFRPDDASRLYRVLVPHTLNNAPATPPADGKWAGRDTLLPGSRYEGWIIRISSAGKTLNITSDPAYLAGYARAWEKQLHAIQLDINGKDTKIPFP